MYHSNQKLSLNTHFTFIWISELVPHLSLSVKPSEFVNEILQIVLKSSIISRITSMHFIGILSELIFQKI